MSLNEAHRIAGIELSLLRRIINQAPDDAINLALGELRFDFPKPYRDYLGKIIQDENPYYTTNAGLPELRAVIAGSYDMVSPEQICVTNGVEEALFTIFTAFVNPGDTVAIPDPDYSAYETIAIMTSAQVIRLSYQSDLRSIDWDLWDLQLGKGVRYLIFSNPKNPTGCILTNDEMTRLIGICDKYHIYLIVDEIYRDVFLQDRPPSFQGLYPRLFIVNGLSKSHCMSGLRLGWIVSPPALSASITKTYQYIATCANYLAQKLAILTFSDVGQSVNQTIRTKLSHCSHLCETNLLNTMHPQQSILPAASPYVMIQTNQDGLHVATELAKRKVIVVPGEAFGKVAKHWNRLNIAHEPSLLERALTILRDYFKASLL